MSSTSRGRRRTATALARRSNNKLNSRQVAISASRASTRTTRSTTSTRSTTLRRGERSQVATNATCSCTPNLYQRVFGPTADETILVGLQTVMSLCEPATSGEVCSDPLAPCAPFVEEEEEEEEDKAESEEKVEDDDDDEKKKESEESSSESRECQTAPCNVCNGSQTDCCCCNMAMQTDAPSVKAVCSQAKYYKCTSAQNYPECLVDKSICIDIPPCHHCKSVQYSKSRSTKVTSCKPSSESCCCCVGTTESNETTGSCCCCSPTPTSSRTPKKSTLKRSSLCSCCRAGMDTTTASSKKCTCSSVVSKRPKQVTLCSDCCSASCAESEVAETGMGDNVCTRYAITKITKFCSYTTFEVMRSTSKKPKSMPKKLEGVFVLKNCKNQ